MWYYRRPSAADVFSSFVVILVVLALGLMLFFYVGAIALAIFMGIGVGIAAVYALIVYIKALVEAIQSLGGNFENSLSGVLKKWATLVMTASGIAFKNNLAVASNALGKSHNYRLISPRRWMWFIVAPATLIIGTAVICAVILLQLFIFVALAFAVIFAMAVYIAVAFLCACGYSVIFFVKYLFDEDLRGIFAFNFTMSASLAELGGAIKNYFVSLWTVCVNVWKNNFDVGRDNRSYASNYKIFMPQYVFLTASLISMPLISTILDAVVLLIGFICFIPIVIACFIWSLIAMLINKIRG